MAWTQERGTMQKCSAGSCPGTGSAMPASLVLSPLNNFPNGKYERRGVCFPPQYQMESSSVKEIELYKQQRLSVTTVDNWSPPALCTGSVLATTKKTELGILKIVCVYVFPVWVYVLVYWCSQRPETFNSLGLPWSWSYKRLWTAQHKC